MGEIMITNFRQKIAEAFNDPLMKKVNEVKGLSIYKAKVKSMLIAAQPHYIVALVPRDMTPFFSYKNLSKLPWISFQTRQVPKNEKDDDLDSCPECEMPSQHNKEPLLNDVITKISQSEEQVTYISQTLPCNLILIPNGANKVARFQDSSVFYKALMFFNTIVTIN